MVGFSVGDGNCRNGLLGDQGDCKLCAFLGHAARHEGIEVGPVDGGLVGLVGLAALGLPGLGLCDGGNPALFGCDCFGFAAFGVCLGLLLALDFLSCLCGSEL